MDFTIPENTQSMMRAIRDFIQHEVYPLEREFLNTSFRDMLPLLVEKREKAKAMGLWAPHLPAELGGQGLSLLEFAHVSEELGRSPLGHYVCNCQAPDVGNMEILMLHGTDEQKERYLAPLIAGEMRSCFSMTEPGYPGSNPTWMGATAVKDGNDYVINGEKWFTTAADGAAFTIVMAITNPEADRYLQASMVIVPAGSPGFKLVRNTSVMGETGSDYASHAEVTFDNCRVPQSNLLGPEGAGFVIAQERLGPGRIHHCMRWIGICERAFDLMCGWAATRQVAPGRTLGSRQIARTWIAESRAEINAARLMVLQAAWKIDQAGSSAARNEISLIKFYVAGVLQRVLDRAIQAHGGMGVTDNLPLAYWYRFERAARIYDGTDEVHKLAVARRILRGYGDT
ncbi:MAG: acyl-CoA dehydrogenase [Chloroflexi bacterium]|nr:MAG: acyl-CoA dehydrogenase [Anaerolineaceae bacterium 4572_32.2]RLC74965.1 MAG: acyl-CoA dehydrogenase [Chloroflexota bacterium]RLC80623.1 MAG: acyl-CoA dehydrogenase [Chloroflexota bacterium]HEY74129.1 acyl-CoA dehydrogenase [Thermoflexia bacterium]